ncbi:MAG TPA: succinate dehydrogenase assembly factor 2 [Burkholderiales bacterium]|jgi:succinate dehydrogenase flavin-adding protein (antitoxin of CptAB toxin-antitoxin module)|nr:succinate dehydrogenase assembly factor 2 [Burkholderiales bacterium]
MGDGRIRWRCRRGLLELDLVLEDFLDRRFGGLDAEQRQLFSELLDQPDNDLLDLAMGRREAAPRYQALVEMLRAA